MSIPRAGSTRQPGGIPPAMADRGPSSAPGKNLGALCLLQAAVALPSPGAETLGGELAGKAAGAQRQAAGARLAGLADVGKCSRLGWYHGVRLLLAVARPGSVTGFGFGPASTHDRVLADAFLALRARPDPRLPTGGQPVAGVYLADAGFSGRAPGALGRGGRGGRDLPAAADRGARLAAAVAALAGGPPAARRSRDRPPADRLPPRRRAAARPDRAAGQAGGQGRPAQLRTRHQPGRRPAAAGDRGGLGLGLIPFSHQALK